MISKCTNNTIVILLMLLCSNLAVAQFKITGKVLNIVGNKPLERATVFVNKTNNATTTDHEGRFTIHNVKPGNYEIIVSVVGFKTYQVPINIQSDVKLPTIALEEKTISLDEVKITKAIKPESKYLEMFKREILGYSKFGKQCKIINPKVIQLNFEKEENKITAYTNDFMIIENKALGYRLKYIVEDFERNEKKELISYIGYVLFENMQGNKKQRLQWKENRVEAYTGSVQHFFRSVLGGNINRENEGGFLVATNTRMRNRFRLSDTLIKEKIRLFSKSSNQTYKDSLFFWNNMLGLPKYIEVIDTTKLRSKHIAALTDQNRLYALKINTDTNYINNWGYVTVPGMKGRTNFRCDTCQFINSLYITYIKGRPKDLGKSYKSISFNKKEESFTPTHEMSEVASLISIIDGNVFFDWNGVIVNPMNLKLERHWANLRLGDLLPVDYLPDIDNE